MPPVATIHAPVSSAVTVPLCVDLDGTLVKSDTLHDSLLALLCRRPGAIPALLPALLHGKAAFKQAVTKAVDLDIEHLPYNRGLLAFLRAEQDRGREIYLATGADARLAQRVADHLGLFKGVVGSDGTTNLTGRKKLEKLRTLAPSGAFDYIGNDSPDVPLLGHADQPMTANATLRLRLGLRARHIRPARSFEDRGPLWISLAKAARLHQWAKNALIFVPVLLAHDLRKPGLLAAAAEFLAFSLAASAMYVFNDLLDIEADRRHPAKSARPFASGDLGIVHALALVCLCGLGAAAAATAVPASAAVWVMVYAGSSAAYSTFFKRIPLVDVLALAGLYTLRLVAGSAATSTPISHWLAGFSLFLFLSLATVKRFAELEKLRAAAIEPRNRRGYRLGDLEQLRSFGTASAYAAVVIFAIYISGSDVTLLYRHPGSLWLVVPLMILWLNRVWLLASRGELDEDPVVFAMTDWMSLLMGAAILAVVLLAI